MFFIRCFNPRTHEECDVRSFVARNTNYVSIHALTRSATELTILASRFLIRFNPRTHEECDLTSGIPSPPPDCFNPRTHEECDGAHLTLVYAPRLFQSTHSRGVRLTQIIGVKLAPCFNPRTHEECDGQPCDDTGLNGCFNPRTHEECDPQALGIVYRKPKFQSTHSRGVRRCGKRRGISRTKFQSTHSRGVRHGQIVREAGLVCFNPRTHEECDYGLQV